MSRKSLQIYQAINQTLKLPRIIGLNPYACQNIFLGKKIRKQKDKYINHHFLEGGKKSSHIHI